MARAELTESVLQPQGSILTYVAGASVTVNVRGGGTATIYQTPTGGATYPQPLTTAYGRIEPVGVPGGECWLDPGSYDVVVTFGSQTWTQRLEIVSGASIAVISESPVNAKDPRFGAIGDGSADDYLTLKAAHDHMLTATRGGELLVPSGDYKVSDTPFAPPTNNQKGCKIGGEGMGGNTPSRPTLITRTADHPVISAVGTGTTPTTTVQGLEVRDLTIHGSPGSGFTTDLVSLLRCATLTMERVRLAKADGRLLYAEQLWNFSFMRCIFEEGGNLATSKPAVLLTSSAADVTNTGDLIDCQWEANNYDGLVLDGTVGPAAAVKVLGGKFERNGGREMHFKNAQGCKLIGAFLYGINSNDPLLVTAGANNVILGNQIESSTDAGATSNYLVNLTGGLRTAVIGNGLTVGSAKAAHVFIAAAVTDVTVFGNGHQGTVTNRINDSRTVKTLGLISSSGRLLAYNGIGTREINATGLTSAQIDALFTEHTPVNGQIVSDPTNGWLLVRQGGKWSRTAALTQIA